VRLPVPPSKAACHTGHNPDEQAANVE